MWIYLSTSTDPFFRGRSTAGRRRGGGAAEKQPNRRPYHAGGTSAWGDAASPLCRCGWGELRQWLPGLMRGVGGELH